MTAAHNRWADDVTREYHIVERSSGEVFAGPFSTFGDAMAAAKKVKRTAKVPLRLRITDSSGEKFVAIPEK
jgi:hypothetical protein